LRRCAVASLREPEPDAVEDAERRYSALRRALGHLANPAVTDPHHPAVVSRVAAVNAVSDAHAKSKATSVTGRLAHLENELDQAGLLEPALRNARSIERFRDEWGLWRGARQAGRRP
jgi:hypothetical protein